MKKINTLKILLLLFLITSVLHLKAQNTVLNCGSDELHSQLLNKNPEYKAKYQKYEKEILRYQERDLSERENPSYVLPVVVHIIHNGGAENISDTEVQTGIDNLNEAYANTGYYDPSTGVNTGIQFCLAQRTPNGNATTGITRTKSSLTNLNANSQDLALKNLERWDPKHYINIWLVKSICRGSNCSVIGYAYLPPAHGTKRDGLVVEAGYFARTKSSSAVQIHEMGHYLGLFHTFQGGCKNDNCLTDGDKVCDTPPDNSTFRVKCGEDFNSCSTDVNSGFATDQNDMYWNYMDYGDLNCYSAFTEGQRKRMVFTIQEIRKSLLDSKACLSPCSSDLIANFTSLRDTILVGEITNFNNQSSANASIFSWEINSKTVSSDKDLTYQFKETGTFTVTLKAYNSDKSCYDFINKTIVVICGAEAGIDVDKTSVLSGETVSFKSKANGSYSYSWYIGNTLIGTGQQIDHIFYDEGVYTIELIVSSGQWGCSDTAKVDIIVTCPVESDFSTSSFFPHKDSLVIFTNNSINATNYVWEINGVKLSTGKNFSYVFTDAGEYTVCLIAKNGDCEKKYCKQIFVLDENTNDCEDVYLKRIGDPEVDETCNDFIFLKNGDILILGGYNNQSLLLTLDKRLKIKYSIGLDFLSDNEYIYTSFLDKEGYIIISGMEYIKSNGRGLYILKYDISSKSIIWKKKIKYNSRNFPTIRTISQLPNGNYLLGGQTYVNGCDAIVLEVNKNNGDIIWQNIYNTGSCEVFRDLIYKDEKIYGIGRFAIHSSAETKFRNVLMKMNNRGEKIWSKNYLVSKSDNARLYGFDLLYDNGLVFITVGDENGANLENSKIQVIKTDLDGNVKFEKGFYVKNSKYNRAINILNLPDGYMVSGNYKYLDDNRKLLLFKINKKGELIWSKSYKVGNSCGDSKVKYKNGILYYIGTSIDNDDKDIFILKLDINGKPIADCDIENKDVDMILTDFGVFKENISVNYVTHTMPYTNLDLKSFTPDLIEEDICKKDCFDTCSIAPDASLVILDSQCKQDSFILNFEICNLGEHTIPINTPVSIYTKNPLTQNSNLIAQFYIPDSIPKNNCKQYSYTIKSPGDITIYAFVNDNGNSTTPFTPDIDLPNTGILECNWDNNLGFLSLRESKTKKLDLGNDTTMCISGIVNLNAGSGFESYKWNDGSTDSIFTAWNPGKYWVEVIDRCGNIQSDTINIIIDKETIIDLGEDLNICLGDEISFNLQGFDSISWSINGEIINCLNECEINLKPDSNTTVFVTANDDNGCYSTDTVNITVDISTVIDLGEDLNICPEEEISFNLQGFDSISWNINGEIINCLNECEINLKPDSNTTVFVIANDVNGCYSTDTVNIEVYDNSDILDLGNDTTMCVTGIINLNAGSGFESYRWNDGSTDSIFTVWNPGKYWVEVIDRCGNIQFDSIEIRIDSSTIIDLGDDISICLGESVEFDMNGFHNYQWTPKEIFDCNDCGKVSIKPKEDVEIIVTANDKKGCYTSDTIKIFVYDEKHIRLPNDTTINLGDKILIIPEFVDNESYSYNWSPDEGLSCFDCYSPVAFPLKTTKYTLELTDENGCTFSDEIEIRIKKNIIIDIPNVFTPNGDGKNDIFYIKGTSKGIKEVNTFKVFDRWGELVYEDSHFFINDPVNGWDGRFKGQRVNPGVYVYLVIVELIDNSQVKYSGDITVIR